MDVQLLFMRARGVPEYSPMGDAAKAICAVRNTPPYVQVSLPFGMLFIWQAVLFETMLVAQLAREFDA